MSGRVWVSCALALDLEREGAIVEIMTGVEMWEVFVPLLRLKVEQWAVRLSLGHPRSSGCRWRAANHQPLPELIPFRAAQDGMSVFMSETWHMPWIQSHARPDSALGLGSKLCAQGWPGSFPSAVGANFTKLFSKQALWQPEKGCCSDFLRMAVSSTDDYSQLLSWGILKQCPSPLSLESYICLKLFV